MVNYVKTTRVRGVYINKNDLVFLFQSEKSRINGCLTLPGGEIYAGEPPVEGLNRKIQEELGVAPKFIEKSPFFVENHVVDRTLYRTLAYQVKLPIELNGSPNGMTPNDSPFEFISLKDSWERQYMLTICARHILHSRQLVQLMQRR